MRHFTGLIALFLFFYPAHTQQVTKEFNRLLVDDDFTNLNGKWEQQSNADNIFIGIPEGFQTWRKNNKSGFFLFSSQEREFSVFEVVTTFNFDSKEGKNQSAGVILQAQQDGSGALLIEINRKKQYRIVRAVNNRLIPISGQGEGWVKAKKAITNDANVIMLRTYDKIYDLYINNVFVTSFTEIEYSQGKIGLYVGAASRIVFERLTIRTDDDHVNDNAQNTGGVDEEKTLSQVIVKLKETINKKDKRILELENEVRANAGRGVADTLLIKQRNEAESKSAACNREMEMLKMEVAVLKIKVQELETFKSLISENENGDIIINLSNLTADQKRQIETLQAELNMQSAQLETAKREKLELQNLLKTRNAENDELRNEKINLMQRIIEKDSAITALEEKVIILDDALTQCTRNCQTPKPKSEKKRSKKQQGDAALFDE